MSYEQPVFVCMEKTSNILAAMVALCENLCYLLKLFAW